MQERSLGSLLVDNKDNGAGEKYLRVCTYNILVDQFCDTEWPRANLYSYCDRNHLNVEVCSCLSSLLSTCLHLVHVCQSFCAILLFKNKTSPRTLSAFLHLGCPPCMYSSKCTRLSCFENSWTLRSVLSLPFFLVILASHSHAFVRVHVSVLLSCHSVPHLHAFVPVR